MTAAPRFFLAISLFIVTVASGLWLSRLGRPYNGLLFNIHKLIALGAVVSFGFQMARGFNARGTSLLMVAVLILIILSVAALFVSGALLSSGHTAGKLWLTLHNIAPFTLAFGCAVLINLLTRGAL